MSHTHRAALALAAMLATPATAWAWGAPGCTNLPEYNRALGALQGMTSACDMSVEQARRVIAAHDAQLGYGQPAYAQPAYARPAPAHGARAHRSAALRATAHRRQRVRTTHR